VGLFLRTRRPGDCIVLEGFTKKLQDYFVDAKIPRGKRELTPLVANDHEVICILDKQGRVRATRGGLTRTYWATLWSETEVS